MAPESRDEVPGQDEVRQRIDSLYDQAESATGNYNATRAMASVKRSRGVPLAKRRRPDPALDEVARQWFEAARAKLGPTVPAVLPADRLPDAPPAERRGRGRWGGTPDALGPAARRTEALERAADRTVAELTAGRPTDPESLALAARESARAALPGPRRPELPGRVGGLPGPSDGGRGAGGAGSMQQPGPGALTTPAGPGTLTAPATGGVPAGLGPVEPAGLGPVEPGGLGAMDAAGLAAGLPSGLGTSGPAGRETGLPAGLGTSGPAGLETRLPAGLGTGDPAGLGTGLPAGLGRSGPAGLETGLPAGLDTGLPAGLGASEPVGLSTGLPAGLGTAEPAGLAAGLTTDPGAAVPGGVGAARAAGLGPAETAVLPMTALSDAQGTPVQEPGPFPGVTRPGRTSPGTSKAANQRKLAAASDVLSRYTARLTTSTAAAHAASVTAAAPPRSMPASPAPVTDVPPASVTAPPTFAPPAPVTAAPPASVMAPPSPPFSAAPPTSTTATPPPAVVPATPPQPAPAPATGQWPGSQGAAAAVPDPRITPDAMASVTGTGSLHPVAESPRTARAAKAIAFARAQIGKPCVWGATGPDSYDCSSLTQAAWRAAGVELPRAAYQQALAGAPVALAGIEPGDLVLFFDDDRHAGLHVGGGMMVHAPGPGASIREESIYGAGEAAIHRIVRPA